jgi:hypothetical protein
MTELPTGLPGESGYFSQPSDTLDPHLFDTRERMLPEVRRFVLDTLIQFMHKMGLDYAHEWLCVWITGSGITYQWSAGRANGDLDVLFGIDITKFYQRNPRWPGLSDAELAAGLNARLRDQLWPLTSNKDFNGQVYEVTFYINPGTGTDIKHIHPYAAYDLTHNRWDVRPPELPSDPSSLHPKEWADWAKRDKDRTDEISKAFVTHMRDLHAAPFNSPGYHSSSAAVTNLIAQANALMDDIHLGRREAFQGESGKGYGDWHNYRWQAAKQSGVIRDLSDMTHAGLDEKEADQIEKYGAPIVDAATALRQAMQVTHRGRYL